jgi:hypothetical protein
VAAGLATKLSQGLIDQLLQRCQQALVAADKSLAQLTPARRAASLAARLQALCDLAAALRLSSNVAESVGLLVGQVLAHPLLYPLKSLRSLVMAMPANLSKDASATTVKPLREAVQAALRQALAAPARRADDQTLDGIEWVCRCTDCTAAIAWAESAQAQSLTLAMAEARRGHVHDSLSAAAAPLVCTTLRQGSPHKLVINKAPGLHDSRLERRRRWEADLEEIEGGTQAVSDGGPAKPRRKPRSVDL